MFCGNCGKEIEENVKFCPHCGGQITKTSGTQGAPLSQPSGMSDSNIKKESAIQNVPYNTMCILGMVIACISLLINFWGIVGMAGLILSIVGLQQVQQSHENGKALAIVGIVIGSFSVIYACMTLMTLFS